MAYDLNRLAADPTYAPGLFRAKKWLYWRPARSYIVKGYSQKPVRLPGIVDDGRDEERATICRDLTRELVRWEAELDRPKVSHGTWGWLISQYRTDDLSDYVKLKANTRADYDAQLDRWMKFIAEIRIADTDYRMIRLWQKGMEKTDRSLHYIRKMFTQLRIVTGYGVMIRAPGARDVRDTLSAMQFSTPPARNVAPTFEQVQAIVAKADEAGYQGFALGIMLQWWLALRAVDVRGQTLDGQWQDGLTWNMLDGTVLRKTPSKTQKTTGQSMEWDLALVPDLLARIEALPADQRVGPMIRQNDGRPFTARRWAMVFRRFADRAGVPEEVRSMDLRAGAITEAKNLGASLTDLQHAATHASPSTTNRYVRDREQAGNKVISLRRTGAQPH